jgi:hypothetical protein
VPAPEIIGRKTGASSIASKISPARRAAALSTLQVIGDPQHLVGCLDALGSAYKKQMATLFDGGRYDKHKIYAEMLALDCFRDVIKELRREQRLHSDPL